MNIKVFAKKIRKFNIDNHWILLLISYFIGMSMGSEASEEFWRTTVDGVTPVIAALFCCISFYDYHLQVNAKYEDAIYLRGSLAETMKFHGFPTEEYFSYIMKRFLPVQAVMAAWAVIFSIVEQSIGEAVVGGIVLGMPFLVWQIRKFMFSYAVTRQKPRWLSILEVLWNALFWILSVALVVTTFWVGILAGYFVLEEWLIPQDDHIISICFTKGMLSVFIIGAVFWPMVLFFLSNTKKKNGIKLIATGMLGVFLAASLCGDLANHTIIEDGYILDSRNFEKKDYRFDDVESFEVFLDEKETAVAMRFQCRDGEKISITMGTYSNTDLWNERYADEYEFVKDVAAQLLDRGAKGTVREPEKIMKTLEEEWALNKDEKKTLREIIGMLE